MNTQVQRALEILRSGDARAFDRALESLQAAVYGFGMKVCGNREDAEDTAQETLLRLARQLKDFPDARALAVWLYKVAKSQCLMSRRQSKFAPAQMLSLEALMPAQIEPASATLKSWEITPEEIALRQEFRAKLEQAILSLPKPYRLVLILRDLEQLETREVAEVMGISEDTTKMRLHRARVHVRNALAGYVQRANPRSPGRSVSPSVDGSAHRRSPAPTTASAGRRRHAGRAEPATAPSGTI
jgi:RNA polymerase sigma-70 factor (ECF subfamily)